MKSILSSLFLFLSLGLYAQQISKNPKAPASSGLFTLGLDAAGNLIQQGKTGQPSYIKIDAATNKLTAYKTIAEVVSSNSSVANSPMVINITDAFRTGSFALDASDNTSLHDGALTLVTASGLRYKRILLDKRITPQMFGAVGDSLTDDGTALNAWLAASGPFGHYWTPGKYRSSVSVFRLNKGAVNITTAGSAVSRLYLSGDSDGLVLQNSATTTGYMQLIGGVTIYSCGPKSAGRIGLYVQNPGQQPGVRVDDYVCLHTDTDPAKEWTYGLYVIDCLSSKFNGITLFGTSLNRMTGIKHTNSSGQVAFNCNYTDVNIQNVMQGIDIEGTNYPAVEGLSFSQTKLVAVRRGLKAVSHTYNAPLLDFLGLHIEAYEQDAYTENFGQITLTNGLFYMTPKTGITPAPEAWKIVNPQIYNLSSLTMYLGVDQTYGINATGSGNSILGNISAICNYGHTSAMHIEQGVGTTNLTILRSWTGQNGPNTGVKIVDDSNQSFVSGTQDTATVTTVQTLDASGNLNVNSNQFAKSILIPASEAGKTLNNLSYRYEGQLITLLFDAPVTVRHLAGSIFLSAQRNRLMPYKSRLTLLRTSQQWEEVSSTGAIMPDLAYTNTYSLAAWSAGTYYNVVPDNTLQAGGTYLVQVLVATGSQMLVQQIYWLTIGLTPAGGTASPIDGTTTSYGPAVAGGPNISLDMKAQITAGTALSQGLYMQTNFTTNSSIGLTINVYRYL